ncbi:MAG: hypothetical protein LBC46_03335 [Treponema sp.]|nr:hypothetical protein [Treponema sp.]
MYQFQLVREKNRARLKRPILVAGAGSGASVWAMAMDWAAVEAASDMRTLVVAPLSKASLLSAGRAAKTRSSPENPLRSASLPASDAKTAPKPRGNSVTGSLSAAIMMRLRAIAQHSAHKPAGFAWLA